MDDGDRARPISLPAAPLFLQFGRLFVAAVGYVEILCAIFRGRAGDPHCRGRLFTAKSAFEASHLKCTRQIYSVMSPPNNGTST